MGVPYYDYSNNGPHRKAFGTFYVPKHDLRGSLFKRLSVADKVNPHAGLGFFGIADGGVGDNSGIGHSLAAGADEIIVFADMPTSVSQTGKQKGSRQIFDVPLVDLCPLCYANFQLFEESKEEIDAQWEQQQTLFYLPPETTTLNSLSIGTLQLTTAQNDYFGTSGGRSVTGLLFRNLF